MFLSKDSLFFIITGFIAAGIVLLATSDYGAGVSPDSIQYINAARKIMKVGGFITTENTPFIWWPPLYPTLLGAIDYVFKVDPLISARILNAVLFGLIVYLTGLLFLKKLTSSIYFVFVCTIYIMVSSTLVQNSLMVWTEPLFIFFILLYFVSFDSYLVKKDLKSLLLMSFSVAFACLTRYIGISLIISGAISLLFINKDSFKIKITHFIIFIFISIFLIGIWVIRNFFLTGTLFGMREHSILTLIQVIGYIYNVFLYWFIPSVIININLTKIISIVLIFFFFIIFVKIIRKKEKRIILSIVSVILFIIIYLTFLIYSATTVEFDKIDNRMLSPVFIPIVLILFIFIENLFSTLLHYLKPNLIKIILVVSIIILSIIPLRATLLLIKNHLDRGAGYTARYWKNSQVIQYLIQHDILKSGFQVYSNHPDAIYILLNFKPEWTASRTAAKNGILDLKGSWPKEKKAYLCWFNEATWPAFFTLEELKQIINLEEIANLDDGKVFIISKKE